jgi:hypothetical protein
MGKIIEPTVNIADILDTINKEPEVISTQYIIDKVIPSTGKYVIFGLQGSGKSTVCQSMAVCISAGIDWLGYKTKQSKVLWINLDDEPSTALNLRIHKLCNALKITRPSSDKLAVLTQADTQSKFSLLSAEEAANLYAVIDAINPDIIFIDSMLKLCPIISGVLDTKPFESMTARYSDKVFMILHHAIERGLTTWDLFNAKDVGGLMARSSQLSRDVDGHFVVAGFMNDEKRNILDHIGIKCGTKRFTLLDIPLRIKVKQSQNGDKPEFIELINDGSFLPPIGLQEYHILDILYHASVPMSPGDIRNESHTAVSPATLYNKINELYDSKWIELIDKGKKGLRFYKISELGKKNFSRACVDNKFKISDEIGVGEEEWQEAKPKKRSKK